MYNRYIPQPDGSFHRRQYPESSVAETNIHTEMSNHHTNSKPEPEPCKATNKTAPQNTNHCCHCQTCKHRKPRADQQGNNFHSFLKQLIPKDLDTGDLMVILLLLLMSSDCAEDQNSTLLTLALYLFL